MFSKHAHICSQSTRDLAQAESLSNSEEDNAGEGYHPDGQKII
jgi:hypothetical protein